jgi:hypothetical protein
MIEFDQKGQLAYKMWSDAPDSLRGKLRQWFPWLESRL